jgi:hypothetical protein
MEEMMKDMIHDTLKSGGGIIETKGHSQEIIVVLMSVKCSLWYFFLLYIYGDILNGG